MIKTERHSKIIAILRDREVIGLRDLRAMLPEVSAVTLRRDLAELAETGTLQRTRGGAMLPQRDEAPSQTNGHAHGEQVSQETFDAIVLPPIDGRGADALRREVARRGLPYIAESAPQKGGLYLGPDNYTAGHDLGRVAGRMLSREQDLAGLLLIDLANLENTRARSAGFAAGFEEAFTGEVSVVRVDGQGSYKVALRAALDAFQSTPGLNVVFGVNDHSALAGRDAAERSGRDVSVFAVGGENAAFVGQLAEDGPLRAVAALFPEVVGFRAIDMVANTLSGRPVGIESVTPHMVLTRETLDEAYRSGPNGWALRSDVRDTLLAAYPTPPAKRLRGRIGFMPHFPAHDWYRVMIQAMQTRCKRYGLGLVITPPDMGIARELTRLRRQIAAAAADIVRPGETVVIGGGEIGLHLAEALKQSAARGDCRNLTVITNALDVLERLTEAPEIKVILTAGEYQAADRCLVGPSLGALFEQMRADRAFLSVDGVSARFGTSSVDERLALAGTRFVRAARSVVAMADHTLIATDANHRICPIADVDVVVTDDGSLPADRLALRDAGVEVHVAADTAGRDDRPTATAVGSRAPEVLHQNEGGRQ